MEIMNAPKLADNQEWVIDSYSTPLGSVRPKKDDPTKFNKFNIAIYKYRYDRWHLFELIGDKGILMAWCVIGLKE
jgi:hypothetical protein